MMNLQVIYEDNHLIAVNKPAGMLVQGDETGDTPIAEHIKKYIKERYNKPGDVFLGTIHRIDRPVSGAVVFARTSKALERMNALFLEQKVEKIYWAVVAERPDPLEGTLVHFLVKDKDKNITRALDGQSRRYPDAKRSELFYELICSMGDNHLLEVHPKTGRSHQIRAQLMRIDCPIRGDLKYGFPKANQDLSIHLHCKQMKFIHPVLKTAITIDADPPTNDPIWRAFANSLL
jgi:23S rRNA pseudouridine1911/1915/1917 synthase